MYIRDPQLDGVDMDYLEPSICQYRGTLVVWGRKRLLGMLRSEGPVVRGGTARIRRWHDLVGLGAVGRHA